MSKDARPKINPIEKMSDEPIVATLGNPVATKLLPKNAPCKSPKMNTNNTRVSSRRSLKAKMFSMAIYKTDKHNNAVRM